MTSLYQHLPPRDMWGERMYTRPELEYPEDLNVYVELLEKNLQAGRAEKVAIRFHDQSITYGVLHRRVNQIGNALRKQGISLGDRVMLRGLNNPDTVFAWLAIGRIGAVNVATMPLLRSREITYMANDAECKAIVCGASLFEEVQKAKEGFQTVKSLFIIGKNSLPLPAGALDLDALSNEEPETCEPAKTKRNDLALIGYTSGSTGEPKGCVSFHDDVLAIADGYAKNILSPTENDVFSGHPSLAFTFGLGALLVFPFRFGSQTVLLEKFSPKAMLETLSTYKVTLAFCAPTCYRMMLDLDPKNTYDLSSLRYGVSAGETLPARIFTRWKTERNIELLDGIGSTEMLHIFLSASPGEAKPGITGKPVPGYEAKVVDESFSELPYGEPGLLAVRGPTSCRYWKKPERQKAYVKNGWNFPGDVFTQDKEGFFHYQCRADDLIVTSGYNVAAVEVENVLNEHEVVKETGVIGVDDDVRGKVVKAFIVLQNQTKASEQLVDELQNWVKQTLAPYKYPRQIEFVTSLPRTDTGKIQRFRLRKP